MAHMGCDAASQGLWSPPSPGVAAGCLQETGCYK
jgi:hypothetical protein